jgi:hypothetical protein
MAVCPFLYEWSELETKLIPDPVLGSGLFKVEHYRHGRFHQISTGGI